MRCNECNVDLGEEYTKCPLCGAEASHDEPILKGIKTAEYPKYDKSLLDEKNEYHTTFPQKYVFRVCFVLSVVISLISIADFSFLMTVGVPVVMTLSSLFYFFYSFKEKGRLLHSILSLLSTVVTLMIFLVVGLITNSEIKLVLSALILSVLLFFAVFVCKPERAKEQLKATFNL